VTTGCAIPPTDSTSTATDLTVGDTPTGVTPARVARAEPSDDTSSSELKLSHFEGLVRAFLRAPACTRHRLREWIIADLAAARRINDRIAIVLREALASSQPGRLGAAIDLLSSPQVNLKQFVQSGLRADLLEAMDEDAAFILVRAAGRRYDHSTELIMPRAVHSLRETVREAAAEALYDLGTPAAVAALTIIADSDSSPIVRQTASERLDDLKEE
jgi:HEAT repeat protein